jgi:hypothetical protein
MLRADQIELAGAAFSMGERGSEMLCGILFWFHFSSTRRKRGPASFNSVKKKSGIPAFAGITTEVYAGTFSVDAP